VLVDNVVREQTAGGWRLSAAVHSAPALDGELLHFTVAGDEGAWLSQRGDAFLAALLLPAMALGEELVIEAPVSARLRRSVRTVMDIYTAWWGDRYRAVQVRCGASAEAVERDGTAAVGLYFTAGVDSFYSLLKDLELSDEAAHEPVTHLLFANFEHHAGPPYERLLARLRRAADDTGRQLVVVDTNVRSLTQPAAYWPDYHGAALASVALALQGLLGRCLIAASDIHPTPPWGSHPVLDHLWSTEALEIVHDGAEATRTEKVVRQIGRSQLALETLSVCWRSEPGHNCGVCEKCLRTMASLEVAGRLSQCTTLPQTLDLQALRVVELGEPERDLMREVAGDASSRGRDDIVDAIEDNLSRYAGSADGPGGQHSVPLPSSRTVRPGPRAVWVS
jgi:hypothetical protein